MTQTADPEGVGPDGVGTLLVPDGAGTPVGRSAARRVPRDPALAFRRKAWMRLRSRAEAAPKKVVAKPDRPALVARFRRAAWSWLGVAKAPVDHAAASVARAHLKGVLEALVFASEHPMSARELTRVAKAEGKVVRAILAELVLDYRSRGFRLDEVAGGYVFRTSPAFSPFVRDEVAKKPVRMTRTQIETLAIVAYRQPVTRPEIDDVRGVDSGAVLKSLLERDLVRILGKKDEPGRPMLYGTTPQFLEFFGLKALADLPTLREFTELSDDSKRAYEREMGEEPDMAMATNETSLMGAEGQLRRSDEPAEAEPTLETASGPGATPVDGEGGEKEKDEDDEDEDEDEDDDEDDDDEDDDDEDDDDEDDDDDEEAEAEDE